MQDGGIVEVGGMEEKCTRRKGKSPPNFIITVEKGEEEGEGKRDSDFPTSMRGKSLALD